MKKVLFFHVTVQNYKPLHIVLNYWVVRHLNRKGSSKKSRELNKNWGKMLLLKCCLKELFLSKQLHLLICLHRKLVRPTCFVTHFLWKPSKRHNKHFTVKYCFCNLSLSHLHTPSFWRLGTENHNWFCSIISYEGEWSLMINKINKA